MQLANGHQKLNIGIVLDTFMQTGRSSTKRTTGKFFGGVLKHLALCFLTDVGKGNKLTKNHQIKCTCHSFNNFFWVSYNELQASVLNSNVNCSVHVQLTGGTAYAHVSAQEPAKSKPTPKRFGTSPLMMIPPWKSDKL